MLSLSKATVSLLRKIDPEKRVLWAARLFWTSILAGIYCSVFVARTPYERVLMAISWGAVNLTCLDVMMTTDVRANEGD